MSVAADKLDLSVATGYDPAVLTAIQANLDKVDVSQVDETVEITLNGVLDSFVAPTQTANVEWVALAVNTNEADLTDVSLNGVAFTAADVAEASSFGLPAGYFVLWVNTADAQVIAGKDIVLSVAGKLDTTITVKVA